MAKNRAVKPTVLTFGDRLSLVRKKRGFSQAELGKKLGIEGDAYGRYERDEVKPSIEMATRIADALEVSMDFLVGRILLELDGATLKRVEEISKLPDEDRAHVYALLDAFIAKSKLRGLL